MKNITFDIIDLNSETQNDFCWIFLDAVLHTNYKTEDEFNTFLGKLNAGWIIKSRSDVDLSPENCLIQAIGDILKNHINSKDMADKCHKELISKWIFYPKLS